MTLVATVADAPQSWSVAACAGLDTEWFYPARGESTRAAKAVCATCVVRVECLDFALANMEKFGIWGGKSERERRRLRKERGTVSLLFDTEDDPEEEITPMDDEEEETAVDLATYRTATLDPPQTNGIANRDCEECGASFHPVRKDQRFCSKECRWTRNRAKAYDQGQRVSKPSKPRNTATTVAKRTTKSTKTTTKADPEVSRSTATNPRNTATTHQLVVDLLLVLAEHPMSEPVQAAAGRLALRLVAVDGA